SCARPPRRGTWLGAHPLRRPSVGTVVAREAPPARGLARRGRQPAGTGRRAVPSAVRWPARCALRAERPDSTRRLLSPRLLPVREDVRPRILLRCQHHRRVHQARRRGWDERLLERLDVESVRRAVPEDEPATAGLAHLLGRDVCVRARRPLAGSAMGDPHAEYTTRLVARRETVDDLVRREAHISRLPLASRM